MRKGVASTVLKRFGLCFLGVAVLAVGAETQERRVIAVSVVDKEANFVGGLTADNFRGEFRGKEVKILSVEPNTEPRKVIVLVDSSVDLVPTNFVASASNASGGNTWQVAWRTASHAVSHLGIAQPTALLTLGDRLQAETGFTRNTNVLLEKLLSAEARIRAATKARLESRQPSNVDSQPGILDGVLSLARDSRIRWRPGDAILVIGTMEDSRSSAKLEDVQKELTQRGLRLFSVWTNEELTGYQSAHFHKGRFSGKKLSEATGGHWVQAKLTKSSLKRMHKTMKPLYTMVRYFYQVEIKVPQNLGKNRKWKLRVVDERGKGMKGVTVAYPRIFLPLEESQSN